MESKIANNLKPIETKEIIQENSKESIFDVYNEPAMTSAIDVLSIIGKHKEVTLRARGDSIPNAVTVANIITQSLLKGNSKIHKITVSSEPIQELGKTLSNIEIILRKI